MTWPDEEEPSGEQLTDRCLIVDAANVVGSTPDGWWRDRVGATGRLRDTLAAADLVGVVLVVEGRARSVGSVPGVDVVAAAGSGDDAVVSVARAHADTGAHPGPCTVVTADRGLRQRVAALGAAVIGPAALRERMNRGRGSRA